MKKIMGTLLLFSTLFLLLDGCEKSPTAVTKSDAPTVAPTVAPRATPTAIPTVDPTATPIVTPNADPQNTESPPELSQELALKLRAEGLEHLSTFIDGGSACGQTEKKTPANKKGYYYYCSDLDTYEKMYQYLEETFTHDIAKNLIDSVVVINNRLSYQGVGWGSNNEWSKASGMIVSRDEETIIYKFIVPNFVEESPAAEIQIEYKYTPNKGWRINSPARSLR
jgi:hypothetical protein